MTCRKNYWGTYFQQLTTYMYKKKGRNTYVVLVRRRQTQNGLFSRGNGNRQPANAKNGGKIVVTWSFLPFDNNNKTLLPRLKSYFKYI